jgi:NTE family protein
MTLRINLALQGGGSHGAFTWGVLDRLLEDEDVEISAISGTSAGALNGAALKVGLQLGGRAGARENLDWLWAQVGAVGDFRISAWMKAYLPFASAVTDAIESALPISPQGLAAQIYTPYSYGSLWINPLESVVRKLHFDLVCSDQNPKLFVSATNVRSGKVRVFQGNEISTDVLLASACLPTVFQAVEVKDPTTHKTEAFWDGGYSANPALFPLYDKALPDDTVIVNINPLWRDALPKSALEIQNRINEISFNASLLGQLRAINFVNKLIADGRIEKGAMKDTRVHLISDDDLMNELSASTKLMPTPYLLFRLKEAGRAAADTFLTRHKSDIGHRSSVDLPALFN